MAYKLFQGCLRGAELWQNSCSFFVKGAAMV